MLDRNETSGAPTTLALVGDWIMQHRVSTRDDPALLRMAQVLRDADVTIANLEGVIDDGTAFPGAAI
jgi:hypothetical protein